MKELYDIIIIGAGPAGSYLASHLSSEMGNVLLLDKRFDDSNSKKEKPCSGLVAIPAQHFLKEMLLTNENGLLAIPRELTIRVIDAKHRKLLHQKEKIYNINRYVMEQNLLSVVPNHVEILKNAVFIDCIEMADNLKEVILKVDGKVKKIYTKILVGADGANSRVRKKILLLDSIDKYTGIEWFIRYDTNKVSPYFNIITDNRLTDYYMWAFPKNGELLIGGIFKNITNPKEIPPLLVDILKDLKIIEGEIEIAGMWAHPILRASKQRELISDNRNGIYLIGEAAGFICPTSAEGYSYAFSSALKLAEVLNDKKSKLNDRQNIRRILRKTARKKFIYNQFIRRVYMTIFGKSY